MSPVTAGFYLFFVLVFAGYWSLKNGSARVCVLLVASYVMYATFDVRFVALLAGSTGVGFLAGSLIERTKRDSRRRLVLIVGLTLCLTVLGVFKYLAFFITSAASALRLLGFGTDPAVLRFVLPIGISFYLFKVMAYLIDVYRGRIPATRSLLVFATYVAFFPQLLAGPIDRPGDLMPQISSVRPFDYTLAVQGSRQVLWGVFKKVAIADGLAWSVARVFDTWQLQSGMVLIVGSVLFSIQIYCDFSGYTDISSGLAKLLGITTVRNFAYPYFSQNVAEFWRRWNISVSSWFRDYVYISLGGSRVAKARLALNIMVTFLLSGLWHGASLTFLAWGALLGAAVCFTALRKVPVLRATDTPGGERVTLAGAGRMLVTFSFITLSWVFFRSESMSQAIGVLVGMLEWSAAAGGTLTPLALFPGTRKLLLVTLVVFGAFEWHQRRRECPLDLQFESRVARWSVYTAVLWLTIVLAQPLSSGRFIYFDF